MKAYNPKGWFGLIFNFHKSDTFRLLLPAMLALTALSAGLCYLHIEMKLVTFKSTMVIHSLLGFVISLVLVFRTNTAYDRWWEGRKVWGDLANNSRNLMFKINAFLPSDKKELKNEFRILISNYSLGLKEHLRGGFKSELLEEHPRLHLQDLKNAEHIPNRIIKQLYLDLEELVKQKVISEERLFILNEELRTFSNVSGACERIKKTPIPYSYNTFIKRIIFLYIVTLPLGLIADLKWATIPVVLFVFYAFASLELLAEEIEDPFGNEVNDLPTDDLANTLKKNLLEIIA